MLKNLDPPTTVRAIRPNDADWRFVEGFMTYPRASVEIDFDCPGSYKDIVLECINRGWIRPIAFMKESDYVWERLQQD